MATLPPLGTNDDFADQLTTGFWDGDTHHWNVTQGGTITVNLTAITADARPVARAALQMWSDIIAVTFQEVTSGGQILFDDLQIGTGAFSDGVWSNGITSSATVNVSPARLGIGPGIARIGLQTYIHEIGHALGLGHTSNANSGTAASVYPDQALWKNDSSATSIMSYFDNLENTYTRSLGFTNNLVVTPQVADIVAVGNLYGLSTTTRTGDTTYGFNNNSGRALFDSALYPTVAYTVFDSAGTDTLDYSGFGSNQLIDLNPEAFSNVGPGHGNVVIARGTIIENAIGGAGADTLTGNAVANRLIGNGGADSLSGGEGDDRLEGRDGDDTMAGGLGDDIFTVESVGDLVIEAASAGTDKVQSSISYALTANVENLTLTGSAALSGTGNGVDNVITGNAAANMLNGAAGADTLNGGLGNDTYVVDNVLDQVIESSASGGFDTVNSSATFSLAGWYTERLTLTGSNGINGTGNSLANTITGNAAANVLNGGAGADTLSGGNGNDRYVVDSAYDKVIEVSAAGGIDTVESAVSFSLAGWYSDRLTLTGANGISGTGNSLANIITGNHAANILNGGAGNDTLVGGAGADKYRFDTLLNSSTNVDTISGFSAADDLILLDNDVFSALTSLGQLAAAQFHAGAAAHDADDRIVYDSSTGKLYYDADGSGSAAQILFAQITAGTALTKADIFVIG